MSMELTLQRLLDEKRLFELPSLFTGFETARTMYVSLEVLAAVSEPFPDDVMMATRRAEFRNWLDAFSEGGHVTVANNPREKPRLAMLARVAPPEEEFFSIRVNDPAETPGIRSLGAFVDTDKFVALTWDLRENIELFDDEVAIVRVAWRGLFGAEAPHSGEFPDDYISINAVSV